jgi:hypothetical protein
LGVNDIAASPESQWRADRAAGFEELPDVLTDDMVAFERVVHY